MSSSCAFPNCGRKVVSKGLCDPHRIQRRKGELYPIGSRPKSKPIPLAERFWDLVDQESGPVHSEHGRCWIWTGAKATKAGRQTYGNVVVTPGKWTKAHRAAWELTHGPTDGLFVLHRCDTPLCVNPAHLFLGTHADNMQDMLAKGRGRWREHRSGA